MTDRAEAVSWARTTQDALLDAVQNLAVVADKVTEVSGEESVSMDAQIALAQLREALSQLQGASPLVTRIAIQRFRDAGMEFVPQLAEESAPRSFLIRVNGGRRRMFVKPGESFMTGDGWFVWVDVRDSETRMSSQAIIEEETVLAGPLTLMADMQMRDCVRSVWLNATTGWEDGHIVGRGEHLPAKFMIEVQRPASARWELAGITPDKDDGRVE